MSQQHYLETSFWNENNNDDDNDSDDEGIGSDDSVDHSEQRCTCNDQKINKSDKNSDTTTSTQQQSKVNLQRILIDYIEEIREAKR